MADDNEMAEMAQGFRQDADDIGAEAAKHLHQRDYPLAATECQRAYLKSVMADVLEEAIRRG